MRDPERWWQTFWRAMVLAVLVGLAYGLLVGCASAPKRNCHVSNCGVVCCNDDGLVCPVCWDLEE